MMRTNFTFFIALICGQLFAQTPAWRQLPGPAGANILQLDRDGNDVYAVTENAVLKSTDGGQTWARTPVERGICQQIHQFQADAGRFYCVFDNQSIGRSLDSGLTWDTILNVLPLVFGELRLLLHGDTLVCGLEYQIYTSTDGGDTWISAPNPADSPDVTDICATSTELFFVNYGDVFRSGNGGKTWEKVFTSSYPISMLAAVGDTLYMKYKRYGRLVRSADGLRTWTTIEVPLWDNLPDTQCRLIPQNDTLFWFPRLNHNTGCDFKFYRSTDAGEHWASLEMSNVPLADVRDVVALPHQLLVGTAFGFEKSTDGGLTFQSLPTTLALSYIHSIFRVGSRIWVGAEGRNYYSDDEGETWHRFISPSPNPCGSELLQSVAGRLLLRPYYTVSPIWVSDDNGATWGLANPPEATTLSIRADENGAFAIGGDFYRKIGGPGNDVFSPLMPWPQTTDDHNRLSIYLVGGHLMACNWDEGRLFIADSTATDWTEIPLSVCPGSGALYFFDGTSLLVRCNGEPNNFQLYNFADETWRRWFPIDWTYGGALYNAPFSLLQQHNRLWLNREGGLYFSWDGSGRFVPFEPRLPEVFPASLLVEEDKIWVGTYYDGLFVIEKPFVRPEDVGRRNFRLSPNPSAGPLRLQSDALPTQPGTLRVFDATGRLLVEDNLWPALSWEYDFSHLPAGFYFLQMQTELGRESLRWVKR